MSDLLPPVFDDLLNHLRENGGRIVIAFHEGDLGVPEPGSPHDRWMVGYEFGKEEPDNPENDMVGGAAYGLGPDLDSAVTQVAEQVGL